MAVAKELEPIGVRLVRPGIQAEGELRAAFSVGGEGAGKGYAITKGAEWVRLSKPGALRVDVPRELVEFIEYEPELAP